MDKQDERRLAETLEEYGRLGIGEQVDYAKFYLYSLVTHSTAIEGSTMTEVENQLLFDEGIAARGRTMGEQLMNLDLKAAYEAGMRLAREHADFSAERLKELAAIVMRNTGGVYRTPLGDFDSSKGDFRLVNVTAGAGGVSYMGYEKVPARVEEFCRQMNGRRRELLERGGGLLDKYLLSFDAHYLLVTIHPWVDGNGRMARLAMNCVQFEFGLVPVKVERDDKAAYIQALVDARERESLEPFREFMLEEHIRNLRREMAAFRKSLDFDPLKGTAFPEAKA